MNFFRFILDFLIFQSKSSLIWLSEMKKKELEQGILTTYQYSFED